jgi:hypothetical protein
MGLLDRVKSSCYILAGDFNTILSQKEKKWGSLVCDPSKEHMEDLIASLDFIDIKPSKGCFT